MRATPGTEPLAHDPHADRDGSLARGDSLAIDGPWEASMRYADMAFACARTDASNESKRLARLASLYGTHARIAEGRAR
jgi:hypothetical protein